jgi:hypothetical protein
MGSRNGPYNADFLVGATVRIVSRPDLERFRSTWKYHHPLSVEQLDHAGQLARVVNAYAYHGGDELYVLDGLPGMWHECCLVAVPDDLGRCKKSDPLK